MHADDDTRPGFTLKRWSARKHAAAREQRGEAPAPLDTPPAAPPPVAVAAAAPGEAPRAEAPAPLPPIESLTPDADFVPFMRPEVDESLKRAALRRLFSDPHFNVMDGLDVYIDDYSKPDPLEPEVARQLAHVRYIFDPPQTRVNEQGHVEDLAQPPVPAETPAATAQLEEGESAAPSSPPPSPADTDSAIRPDASLPSPEAGERRIV